MLKALHILAFAVLASGQNPQLTGPGGIVAPGGATTTLPIPDKNARPGSGSYASMAPHSNAAGEVPHYAEITLFPPQRWGRTTCMVEDTLAATANNNQNCDHVVVELVGVSTIPPNAESDESTFVPFNQYPRATWENLVFRLPGFDSGDLFPQSVQVTSSPPCLFTAIVSAGGKSIKFMVQECALTRQIDVTANPGTGTGIFWQSVFDKLVLFVPWPYLAANPLYPHGVVDTQATFFMADETPAAFTKVGPFRANTPYYIHSSPFVLPSLQFLELIPGAPAGGIKPNTIAGQSLDAMTVTALLGLQLNSGMKIAVTVSLGPVDISGADVTAAAAAPPAAFPTAASGKLGLIWAVPGSVPTNTFIAIGPGCARSASSVHCCSQSVAEILVPQVSVVTYPEWFATLSITLGPVGCVIPSNRRVSFVIPKAYLGKNPSQTVAPNAATNTLPVPGFWAVQALLYTTVEPSMHFFRRHGGDLSPAAYQQGTFHTLTAGAQPVLLYNQETPAALPAAVRMTERDLALGGVLSSYVVGPSAFRSATFTIDTNIVLAQPTKVDVSITLNKGLVRLVDTTQNPPGRLQTTPYFITLYFTAGVIRPNVGSLSNPIRLPVSAPSRCANAFSALSTVTNNLLVWFDDDSCVSALGTDGTVISFTIIEQFLYRNVAAGFSPTVDVRLVPPLNSVASGQSGLAAVANSAGLDSAMLMAVPAWTTVANCANMPSNLGAVNDIWAMTPAARCVLADSILRISAITAAYLQCNPGATIHNAQSLTTFVKYPEGTFNGAYYPGTNLPPPASTWPQNVALGGTPAVYIVNYGIMFSTPMLAVIVSYPPATQSLKAIGASPSVPASYTLAFLVRVSRITTACSTVNELNPFEFCVALPRPVVNPLWFPAATPTAGGAPVSAATYGFATDLKANIACFIIPNDGAVAAWYPIGASPNSDDDSDGAWYAFFALFALPLLLLCCCLAALLYFLKMRKPKTCCPAVPQYPVQEMYWVNNAAPGVYAPAATPLYLTQ